MATRESRAAEGITVLRKLREVGVEDDNPGTKTIKDAIRTWIEDGAPCLVERIDFGRLNRVGTLELTRTGKASLSLKVPRITNH
jgi:hypothetical protein